MHDIKPITTTSHGH